MIEIEDDLEAKVGDAQANLPKSTDLTSKTQMKEVLKKNVEDVIMYTHMESKTAMQLGKIWLMSETWPLSIMLQDEKITRTD